MSNPTWFYARSGQQIGPVEFDELRRLSQSGQLVPADLVWSEGMADWAPAVTIHGLFSSAIPGSVGHAAPPPGYPLQTINYYTPSQTARYAGFWIRFCAAFIDGLITAVFGAVVGFIAGGLVGLMMGAQGSSMESIEVAGEIVGQLLGIVISWLYEAIMTSSTRQATLGKMAVGIRVTDLAGQRISFGRATGRHFAKFISGLILAIGYIMAAFTERKQALHDMMASTLVVYR